MLPAQLWLKVRAPLRDIGLPELVLAPVRIDAMEWNEMRSHGLAIPERQEMYPLATAEQDALDQTSAYVRRYRPELLQPLNLGSYGSE